MTHDSDFFTAEDERFMGQMGVACGDKAIDRCERLGVTISLDYFRELLQRVELAEVESARLASSERLLRACKVALFFAAVAAGSLVAVWRSNV